MVKVTLEKCISVLIFTNVTPTVSFRLHFVLETYIAPLGVREKLIPAIICSEFLYWNKYLYRWNKLQYWIIVLALYKYYIMLILIYWCYWFFFIFISKSQDHVLISNEHNSRLYAKWHKTWYRTHFKWGRYQAVCKWKVYATK